MSQTVKREVWRGPASLTTSDGENYTTERDVLIVDDWRDTPIGRANLGFVKLGPVRFVAHPTAREGE